MVRKIGQHAPEYEGFRGRESGRTGEDQEVLGYEEADARDMVCGDLAQDESGNPDQRSPEHDEAEMEPAMAEALVEDAK